MRSASGNPFPSSLPPFLNASVLFYITRYTNYVLQCAPWPLLRHHIDKFLIFFWKPWLLFVGHGASCARSCGHSVEGAKNKIEVHLGKEGGGGGGHKEGWGEILSREGRRGASKSKHCGMLNSNGNGKTVAVPKAPPPPPPSFAPTRAPGFSPVQFRKAQTLHSSALDRASCGGTAQPSPRWLSVSTRCLRSDGKTEGEGGEGNGRGLCWQALLRRHLRENGCAPGEVRRSGRGSGMGGGEPARFLRRACWGKGLVAVGRACGRICHPSITSASSRCRRKGGRKEREGRESRAGDRRG
jgi:hypothetical protein